MVQQKLLEVDDKWGREQTSCQMKVFQVNSREKSQLHTRLQAWKEAWLPGMLPGDSGVVSISVTTTGNSLVVQWLGLQTSIAVGTGSLSGQGTKIPHSGCMVRPKTKQKNKIAILFFS